MFWDTSLKKISRVTEGQSCEHPVRRYVDLLILLFQSNIRESRLKLKNLIKGHD